MNRLIKFLEDNGYRASDASCKVYRKIIDTSSDVDLCVSFYIEEMNTFSMKAYDYSWHYFDFKMMLLDSYADLNSEERSLSNFQSSDNIRISHRIINTCLIKDEVNKLIKGMMDKENISEFLKNNGYFSYDNDSILRKNINIENGCGSFDISFYKHNKLYSMEAFEYSWTYDFFNLILLNSFVDLKILYNALTKPLLQDNYYIMSKKARMNLLLNEITELVLKRMNIF